MNMTTIRNVLGVAALLLSAFVAGGAIGVRACHIVDARLGSDTWRRP